MTYIQKVRALDTVAKFLYGRDRSWVGHSGVWAIHDAMMRRSFWQKCHGCGE